MNHNNALSSIVALISLFFISWLLCSPTTAEAEAIKAQQWEITADKLTRYEDPPSVIAEGNVILKKTESVTRQKRVEQTTGWAGLLEESPGPVETDRDRVTTVTSTKVITTIKADWIVYDLDLGTVKIRGNVLIDVGPDQLAADEGTINLNRETGSFTNATIIRQYKDMHMEGRKIEKTGDISYHIEDGWIITCKLQNGEAPPWSFGASEADITDNGYAFLKHAVFRIKGVPILYSPIMLLPAKRTRQTGFLFPALSQSDRDGFGLEFPFFINLSPSSDITLYPQYMSKRGFMAGAELRYVLDQESKGMLMANFLHDELSDINDPDDADYYNDGNYTHTNKNRYWIRGKADQDIAEWITRLDVDVVSDRDYLTEFNTGMTGFSDTNSRFFEVFGRGFQNRTEDQRTSTFRTLRSWGNGMSLQANLLAVNDLRLSKDSPSPLWKLPELNFSGLMPLYDSGVDFSWNADYVYYWREEGVGSHRVDLFPRVTMAVPLSDYLETTVGAGIRDTLYGIQSNDDPDWRDSDTENRFLIDIQGEIGTTMMRDYAADIGTVTGWTHTFRPYVNYRFIPDVDQDNLPQFDSVDAVADQNQFTYGIDNFFSLSGQINGTGYQRDYGYIKIQQGYDLRSSESETPWTPVNMRLAYYPLHDLRIIYRTDMDVYGDGLTQHTVEGGYRNSRGDIFVTDYRYDKYADTSSITAAAKVALWYNFTAGYSIERSIEDSITVEEKFNLLYQAPCWSVELAANQTPGNQKVTVMFRLANIGAPFGMDMPGF